VEAESNTSTVTLRLVRGDEKGSLKSENVKYGHESQMTQTRERLGWWGPAAYTKDGPVLSSEREPQKRPYLSKSKWAQDGARDQDLWMTDHQSQCDFDFPCGGRVEYLHHCPASRRRRRKRSLKSESVKYGYEPQGTRARERLGWWGPAAYKKDGPVLLSEREPQKSKTVTVKN
jgi:hypothetical protein